MGNAKIIVVLFDRLEMISRRSGQEIRQYISLTFGTIDKIDLLFAQIEK